MIGARNRRCGAPIGRVRAIAERTRCRWPDPPDGEIVRALLARSRNPMRSPLATYPDAIDAAASRATSSEVGRSGFPPGRSGSTASTEISSRLSMTTITVASAVEKLRLT